VAQKVARSIEAVVHARLTARTWQDRLEASTSLRTKPYEVIMPFHLSAQPSRLTSPTLESQQRQYAKAELQLLSRLVPASMTRGKPRLAAFCVVLSIDAWVRQRRDLGFGTAAARRAMVEGARAPTADADQVKRHRPMALLNCKCTAGIRCRAAPPDRERLP
jgi:hypothetical protein